MKENYVPFIIADFRAYLHCMQDGDYGLAMAMAEQAAEKSLKGILKCYTDLPPYQQKSNCCAFLLTECQKFGVEINLDEESMFFLMFFVKHFSLKKASEFPVFSKGFSLL